MLVNPFIVNKIFSFVKMQNTQETKEERKEDMELLDQTGRSLHWLVYRQIFIVP